MRRLTSIALCLALAGCGLSDSVSASKQDSQIIPSSGVFTEVKEAAYAARFENIVKAFASGTTTTGYNTEIFLAKA